MSFDFANLPIGQGQQFGRDVQLSFPGTTKLHRGFFPSKRTSGCLPFAGKGRLGS
jgi:hypothetical protein